MKVVKAKRYNFQCESLKNGLVVASRHSVEDNLVVNEGNTGDVCLSAID